MTRPRPSLSARALEQARRFVRTESSSGIALLLAAAVALVWANSVWRDSYQDLWHTRLTVGLGSRAIEMDLRHWVNEALMAVFFFVVTLEIKREALAGELRDPRAAALPIAGALGGMAVPAALYTVFNAGGEGSAGWGIPMATDIAFALGVLALVGRGMPPQAKLFLLTLAIADDMGSIAVIAVFYAGGISWPALGIAAGALALLAALARLRAAPPPVALALGAVAWIATFESGVHATIAGVALGLLTPARRIGGGESTLERWEERLHPWTGFLVIPLFALANAGVPLGARAIGDVLSSRVGLGVLAGLVVGKTAGISLAAWLAVRARLARLPDGVGWGQIIGISATAGVGFTVSIFIAGLAFADPELEKRAVLAVLLASALAAALGAAILAPARQAARGLRRQRTRRVGT